jgi:UDP-N-acetylmuramate: L-alanyl-gamma-D-glutamyl-meso-diaminopimelate ligase
MRLHFIGICGTGMGSLAGLCQKRGHQVRGSDTDVYPPMSTQLAAWGIPVATGFLPEHITWEPGLLPEAVVVGNVCRKDNPEVLEAQRLGLPLVSFPQLLGQEFLARGHSVVVAGTHGKTTTSSLVSWLLGHAGRDPGFLIGGIPLNFGRGYAEGHDGGEFVVEGDEYDTAFFDKGPKFLHYRPGTVLLTSVEYDHADIYASLEAVAEAFRKLLVLVPSALAGGRIVVCAHEPLAVELASARAGATLVETYAVDDGTAEAGAAAQGATWVARDVAAREGGFSFTLHRRGKRLGPLRSPLAGLHNLRNAVGALATVMGRGVPFEVARDGLAAFAGVKRRQEVRGVQDGVTVIDDFAHHPTAVRETLRALRGRMDPAAGGRLIAVYEPRTATSRTRVFQAEYPAAFGEADLVVVARPHAPHKVREEDRFDSQAVVRDLQAAGRHAAFGPTVDGPGGVVEQVLSLARPGDHVAVMSTGGFEGLIDKLLAALQQRAAAPAAASRVAS